MSERVDYDTVAAVYGSRYDRNDYSGVEQAVTGFVASAAADATPGVLEVGCGTGHWLRILGKSGVNGVGLDCSGGMLQGARMAVSPPRLVRGRAEALPCRAASCDRIFCVNALHHFTDPHAFFDEAARVLRPGGGLLTIGLDPHTGSDSWWIYDYFPAALAADRKRYLPASIIRALMAASGFVRCKTMVVQHRPAAVTMKEALRRGFLDRSSTSQLLVISQMEYDAGIARVHAADAAAPGGLVLRADLRLYGTVAWLPVGA
jgi:ubiquinone/menaquinone biosynthesis C-methylase UbiE